MNLERVQGNEVRQRRMRRHRFVQLDVFTRAAFSGNPLAVFPEAEGLTGEEMQRIAREMNLSETVFVLPSREPRALRRLRIFTPASELPLAGHPVVGAWNLLAREGLVPAPEGGTGSARIEHELGVGVLPVEIEFTDGEPQRVVMTQGEFVIEQEMIDRGSREEAARCLGLDVGDLDSALPLATVSTGVRALVVPLRTLGDLSRCRPDASALSEFCRRAGALGCYAFTKENFDGGASGAHARFFAPEEGITEDPATGSAAGALGGYLVHYGALEHKEEAVSFTVEQGDFIKRPSRIEVEIRGARGRVETVRVGGPSVVVARGELMF